MLQSERTGIGIGRWLMSACPSLPPAPLLAEHAPLDTGWRTKSDSAKAEHTVLDGRFQLQSLLGKGGMAEVFRATDLRQGRVVAVKILRDDVLDLFGVERFRREISVTAAFTHPHILGLLESGETTDGKGQSLRPPE